MAGATILGSNFLQYIHCVVPRFTNLYVISRRIRFFTVPTPIRSPAIADDFSKHPAQHPNLDSENLNSLCKDYRFKEVSLWQHCANMKALSKDKQIHGHMVVTDFDQSISISTELVSMYTTRGSMADARLIFDKLSKPRKALLWNVMMRGYAMHGLCEEAIELYCQMLAAGTQTDNVTFAIVLKACAKLSALQEGMEIHGHVIKRGLDSNVFIGTTLLTMYVKCSCVEFARQVFDKMRTRDVVSWNALIAGYAQNGSDVEALRLFKEMQLAGVNPSSVSLVNILPACAHMASVREGQEIHGCAIRRGFESEVIEGGALIDMYTASGNVEIARRVFDIMYQRSLVSWTAMIRGYARNKLWDEVLALFCQMKQAGFSPDKFTFPLVLKACENLLCLEHGKQIHGHIIKSELEMDAFVETALIDMYAECDSIEDAYRVFQKMPYRDDISWNAMIGKYAQNRHANKALELFRSMQLVGLKPNGFTLVSILPACSHLAALQLGKEIHGYLIRRGSESDVFAGSALIDMYAKCKKVDISRKIFENLSGKNVVSWNAMITGYTQNGYANEALELFSRMQFAGVKPNPITIAGALQACACLAVLLKGKEIHNFVIKSGLDSDVFAGNMLIVMYAKCGCIEIAETVFNKMCQRNVVSWTAMIAGYGIHGLSEEAFVLFKKMQLAGMKPDGITFIAVLCACSHAGMVDEGLQYFHLMSRDYLITPQVEHYACMVDLLGRAGWLDEAIEFIKNMPLEPNSSVWGALLGACRMHSCIELGEHASKWLLYLEPGNSGNHVLLSNIYAEAGRWDDVAKVRRGMKGKGINKKPGYSWIEVNNRVHAFLAGDRSHPQSERIYAMLDSLAGQMLKEGYVPDTTFVLHDAKVNEYSWVYRNLLWDIYAGYQELPSTKHLS